MDNRRALRRNAVDLGAVRRRTEPVFVGVLFKVDPERVFQHFREPSRGDEPFDDGEGNRGLAPTFVANAADGNTSAVRRGNQHAAQAPSTVNMSAPQGE